MDPRVIGAIGTAYYARAVAAADQARTRAQNGFAIASFLAGGLVGASLLSTLTPVSAVARIIGACALAAWIVTAALYAKAIAEPVELVSGEDQKTPEGFVKKVLENAADERDRVDARGHTAHSASLVAAAITAATVIVGLLVHRTEATEAASVVISQRGAAAFQALCGTSATLVRGKLDIASLSGEFVKLRPDSPRCGGRNVRILRSEIVEVSTAS
jgi:hypothetical protein